MKSIPQENENLAITQWEFERLPLLWREKEATKCLFRGLEKMIRTWVHFWIGCWTFLGLYRDWTYIPHDLDLDISATLDWNDYKEWETKIREIFSDWELIRTIHYKGRVFQLAYIWNNVIFDITFYYTGIKEWKLVSISDVWTVEEDDSLFRYMIPYPAEEYLEMRYGDWKTPTGEQKPRNYNCETLSYKEFNA